MIELRGKYNTAKVFTDNVEETAISQIIDLCNQPFTEGSKIRIMSDCHSGTGCTIGTTMTIQDKIVSNLVGVDIGCVDKDTEFMTVNGWKKISNYNNEEILTYNRENNSSYFEKPIAIIKLPCDNFYHIKTKYGVNQMLSSEHKMLMVTGYSYRPAS